MLNENPDFESIIEKLREIDSDAFESGLELVKINNRLGIDKSYLWFCIIFYFKKEQLKNIVFPEHITKKLDLFYSLKQIESEHKEFGNKYSNIFLAKLDDFRILLAFFADKVVELTDSPSDD